MDIYGHTYRQTNKTNINLYRGGRLDIQRERERQRQRETETETGGERERGGEVSKREMQRMCECGQVTFNVVFMNW